MRAKGRGAEGANAGILGGAAESRRSPIALWLVPALAFVLIVGSLGVFSDLALEHLVWQEMVVWVAAVYAVVATVTALVIPRLQLIPSAAFGAASGILAASAMAALFLALGAGEVSRVIPITSSYPVVTGLLAALILSERVTLGRLAGTLLVIAGVIIILIE